MRAHPYKQMTFQLLQPTVNHPKSWLIFVNYIVLLTAVLGFQPLRVNFYNVGKQTTGHDVLLYNEHIPPVPSAKHLGITMYSNLRTMDRN